MTFPKAPKDKIFERVINPYPTEVLQHPQSIKMSEGMMHIRDVEGPKKTGSMETRLEAMEQQVFKFQGMVERGLNANHMMVTEFANNHKMDAIDIGKHLSRLYDRLDQLQGQIYDLQNQYFFYEEDSDFLREETLAPPKAPTREVVRKIFASVADLRAPEYAKKGKALPKDAPAKKAGVKRPGKRSIHLVGRKTSIQLQHEVDSVEIPCSEDEDEDDDDDDDDEDESPPPTTTRFSTQPR
ncbi:40S ribosomal protein S5-1 [Hordeum vulgare]|nr:40S ribosomal protein S5-1 [Hordeum vulgare]